MSASKVYFTDMRCPVGTSLLQKLTKLMHKAGIDAIDMESKFVAIKLHFGEPGNLSFLRPNFAKTVADLVKEKGGLPFLTDCNTLRLFAPVHRLSDHHRRRPQGHGRHRSARDRRQALHQRQNRPRRHGRRHFHFPESLQGA